MQGHVDLHNEFSRHEVEEPFSDAAPLGLSGRLSASMVAPQSIPGLGLRVRAGVWFNRRFKPSREMVQPSLLLWIENTPVALFPDRLEFSGAEKTMLFEPPL